MVTCIGIDVPELAAGQGRLLDRLDGLMTNDGRST